MTERQEHSNPWADKLQEVQMPDVNDSWNAMETLLDREMPVGGQQDRRRWLLLVLLLLLLIGVCNCPRLNHWYQGGHGPASSSAGGRQDSADRKTGVPEGRDSVGQEPGVAGARGTAGGESGVPEGQSSIGQQPSDTKEQGLIDHGSSVPEGQTVVEPGAGGQGGQASRKSGGRGGQISGDTAALVVAGTPAPVAVDAVMTVTGSRPKGFGSSGRKKNPGKPATARGVNRGSRSGIPVISGARGTDTSSRPGASSGSGVRVPAGVSGSSRAGSRPGVTGTSDASVPSDSSSTSGISAMPADSTSPGTPAAGVPKAGGSNTPGKKAAGSSPALPGKKTTDMTRSKPADTTRRKPAEQAAVKKNPDKPGEEDDVKGFVAGLGLNQFFSVGQQQPSNYNSGGTTGGIGDYIPVPMLRYYFSRKLYVQLEAQFNAPQYTKKDLVGGQSKADTIYPGRVEQNSVIIKKLFYFNLPFSVHYSPFKNLYLGAGLQYSRLSNGVGVVENVVMTTGAADSVKVTKAYSFKGDSIYQKMRTNEFRVLFDVNYTYKKFILGVRYNQALSRFLDVRISDTKVTQARNSSLQLYLRYILWDNRKKKLLPSK